MPPFRGPRTALPSSSAVRSSNKLCSGSKLQADKDRRPNGEVPKNNFRDFNINAPV